MARRSLIAVGAAAAALPLALGIVGTAGAASAGVRLAGSSPVLAPGVAPQGAVPKNERISIQVQLKLPNEAALNAFALAVSTPGRAQYGKYLSPEQFRARFSPSAGQLARVASWLGKQGLQVTGFPANRFYVTAEGTAAQIESVFHTSLATVTANGQQRRVNSPDPTIPADLAVDVDGITGITEVLAHPTHVGGRDENPPSSDGTSSAESVEPSSSASAPPSAGFRVAGPCSSLLGREGGDEPATVRLGLPEPAPVGAVRLPAEPAAGCLRHEQRRRRRRRRARRDGGDHRRVRVADHRQRHHDLRAAQRPDPPVGRRPVLAEGLPSRPLAGPKQVRRLGLVRRGDARRRSGPRHGTRSQRLLRRRHAAATTAT